MNARAVAITAKLGGKVIIEGASLEVREDEVVGLIGPNGGGKSTLLRCVYRVLRPQAGRVWLDEQDIWKLSPRESARRVAVVTQESPAGFDFRVFDLVMLGRLPHIGGARRANESDVRLVEGSLERVGARHLAGRSFSTLSGGEKQRVLIARALAQQPRLLILDEPTNHLDISHQISILTLIRGLKVPSLVAIHDLNLAAEYCARLYVISGGRIVASGTPTEVLTPEFVSSVFSVGAAKITNPVTGVMQLAFYPLP